MNTQETVKSILGLFEKFVDPEGETLDRYEEVKEELTEAISLLIYNEAVKDSKPLVEPEGDARFPELEEDEWEARSALRWGSKLAFSGTKDECIAYAERNGKIKSIAHGTVYFSHTDSEEEC